MSLTTRKLHPLVGAEIVGVDVKTADEATFTAIVAAFNEHSVLLFRGQALTDEQQIAFSRRFGPLETTIRSIATQESTPNHIANLSNVDADGRLIPAGDKRNIYNAGNQMWHTDSSFKKVPAMASLLSAREIPAEGGETQFASMRVGYARLPVDMQRFLEDKVAIHSFVYSRGLVDDALMPPDHAAQVPPVRQALVRANPVNGRKGFYVGSHACEIVGMPTAEARALLRELREAATRPELVYTHRWRLGEVVVIRHPLVQHKLGLMRRKDTSTSEFRSLLAEISMLLAYEVTRDLPTHEVAAETPVAATTIRLLDGKKIVLVSILRAGNGLLDGMLRILPSARVGHVGLYRDPTTLQAVEYYFKLPHEMAERDVVVLDPMLATGNSAIAAVSRVRATRPRSIRFVCLLTCPEGLASFHRVHPDVPVYTAAIDSHLNEHGYIVPGLGDAGDRLFGTR